MIIMNLHQLGTSMLLWEEDRCTVVNEYTCQLLHRMKFNVLDMNLYASKKSFFILLVFLFYYSVKIKIETS